MGALIRCAWMLMTGISTSGPSLAVSLGSHSNPNQVSTLELRMHRHSPTGLDQSGRCSSVVVGTAPLTLLLASHCFRNVDVDPDTGAPVVEILHAPDGFEARVRFAIYREYRVYNNNLAKDQAVLVFDVKGPVPWPAIPIAKYADAPEVMICGYGVMNLEAVTSEPRCAIKKTVRDLTAVDEFLPPFYKTQDLVTWTKYDAIFRTTAKFVSSVDKLIAVARLENHRFAVGAAMPVEVDSGGPWFTMNTRGDLRVVATTSFGHSFAQFGNTVWSAFENKRILPADLTWSYYGVRLHTEEARQLIDEARERGADIREEP